MPAHRETISSPHNTTLPLLLTAAALCGFMGLALQLCWIRLAALAFGSTNSALSSVVAAFFGGSALGAFIFGRWSARTTQWARLAAILAISLGIVAGCTPLLLNISNLLFGMLYQPLQEHHTLQILMRIILIGAAILPASFLCGAIFPLLCQLAANANNSPATLSRLYAATTAGGLAGCLMVGYWLIPALGISLTIYGCSALCLVLGIAACVLIAAVGAQNVANTPQVHTLPHPAPPNRPAGFWRDTILMSLFMFSGFAALAYEVLWARFLSLIIHTTAYTSVLCLAAILLGIIIGSLLVPLLWQRWRPLFLFGLVQALIGIVAAAILLCPVSTWNWIADSKNIALQALFCMVAFSPPAILMGIAFPLAMRIAATQPAVQGSRIGRLIFVNTLGGIAGSLITGFILLPMVGMQQTLLILTLLCTTIGMYALVLDASAATVRRTVGWGILLLCAASAVWVASPVRLPHDFLSKNGRIREIIEGTSSFISVVERDHELRLEIDGMWQGQKSKTYQIMAMHLPLLLHQHPKNILVIGMGTGTAARRALLYDSTRLTCVDVEREVPDLVARHFDGEWLKNPRVRFVAEDGRTLLRHSSDVYDVISIEAGQTFRPQVASLYTLEFYRIAQARLAAGGLVAQFVPIGFMTQPELAGVIKTFTTVFPYSTLWFNKYAELILIGSSDQPHLLTAARLDLLTDQPAIHADLDYSYYNEPNQQQNRPEILTANFLMGSTGLAVLAKGGTVYRDDRPQLEYRSASIPYTPSRFYALIRENLADPSLILDKATDAATTAVIRTVQRKNIRIELNN